MTLHGSDSLHFFLDCEFCQQFGLCHFNPKLEQLQQQLYQNEPNKQLTLLQPILMLHSPNDYMMYCNSDPFSCENLHDLLKIF